MHEYDPSNSDDAKLMNALTNNRSVKINLFTGLGLGSAHNSDDDITPTSPTNNKTRTTTNKQKSLSTRSNKTVHMHPTFDSIESNNTVINNNNNNKGSDNNINNNNNNDNFELLSPSGTVRYNDNPHATIHVHQTSSDGGNNRLSATSNQIKKTVTFGFNPG